MDNNINSNNNYLPPIQSPFPSNNFVHHSNSNNNNNINYHHISSQSNNVFPRNRSTININRYNNSYNFQTPRNQPTNDYYYGYGTQTNEILNGYTPQMNNRVLRHSPSYSSDDFIRRGNCNEEIFDLREYQRRISQREQELMQKYKNGFYGNNRLIKRDYNNNMYINQVNEPKRYVSPLVLNNSRRHLVSVNPCKLNISNMFNNVLCFIDNERGAELGESQLKINPILFPIDTYSYDYNRARFNKKFGPYSAKIFV